jgi:ABC-2 type transport system permease protein
MKTLLWKEICEQWRTRRMIVAAAVLTALGLMGPLSAKYLPVLLANLAEVPEGLAEFLPTPDVAMALGEYLDNLIQFGVILAILVPMSAVVGERTSGTAEITLSKPVGRGAFLLAKFLGYTVTLTAGIALASLAGYYYTGLLFEWVPVGRFLALNGLVLVYLVLFVAVSLLAGTLGRSQLAVAGMTFGFLVLLGLLGALPAVKPYLPTAILAWARALGISITAPPAWESLGVTCALTVACLVGAWGVFRRQEI